MAGGQGQAWQQMVGVGREGGGSAAGAGMGKAADGSTSRVAIEAGVTPGGGEQGMKAQQEREQEQVRATTGAKLAGTKCLGNRRGECCTGRSS